MKPSSQLPLRRLLSVLNPSYYQEPLLSRPAAQSAGVIAERPGATGMSLQPWGRGMQAALHCTSFGTILRLAERHAGLQLECLPCDPEPQVPPDFLPQAWELSVMLPVGVLWESVCVCVCVCEREREFLSSNKLHK